MSKMYQASLYFNDLEGMQKCGFVIGEQRRYSLAIGEGKKYGFVIGVP